jgi:hypothetical protein
MFWATLLSVAGLCVVLLMPSPALAACALLTLLVAGLATAALVGERTVDAAVLLGAYYLVRFPLVAQFPAATWVGDWFSLVTLVLVAVGLAQGRFRVRWFDWTALGLAAAVLAWSLLGAHVPPVPALVQVRAMLGLYPVYVFFREAGFSDFERLAGNARTYLLVAVAGIAVVAAAEKIGHKVLGAVATVRADALAGSLGPNNFPRAYGLTGNPNTLGAVAVLLTVLVLVAFARGALGRWDAYPALGALAMTIVLTVSRSAALGFVVMVVALAVLGGLGPRLPGMRALSMLGIGALLGLAMAAVVVAASLGAPPPSGVAGGTGNDLLVYTRFFVGGEEVGRSAQEGRLYTIKTAGRILAERPAVAVVGDGLGTFGGSGSKTWRPPLYDRFGIATGFNSDFMYGTLLIETGLIALVAFLVVVFAIVRAGPGPSAVRWGLLGVFALWGLFYNVFEMHVVFYLWLLTAGTALTLIPDAEGPAGIADAADGSETADPAPSSATTGAVR